MDRELLKKELEVDEGRVAHAYKDSLGFLTIGVGRLIDQRRGGRLRDDEIDFLLENDITEKEADLDRELPWWREHDTVTQRVLLNLCFQLGIGGLLKFHNTLRALKERRYADAAAGLRASRLYQQTPKRTERRTKLLEEQEKRK